LSKDNKSDEWTWPDNSPLRNFTQSIRLRSAKETRLNLAATAE